MSGEALYERYKEALQRGHVASVQGRVMDALTAYAEAAEIAPERATPHSSAGAALMRSGRPGEAIEQYEVALRLAPRDLPALRGRAGALQALDRRHEAADAYDALAEACDAAGKLADAVDAARRGLELAEGRERRRTLRTLVERLRATDLEDPGRLALERALRVLDEGQAAPAVSAPADGTGVVAGDEHGAADPALQAEAEVPARRAVLDRDLPPDADPVLMAEAAGAALDGDDPGLAIERLLDVASAYRRAGSPDAALDACYAGLSVVPDHALLHLALVELYDERGWRPLADEKLALLDRLATLDDDAGVVAEVARVRATRA
jgi:tetratricopeptide (TPR) repeat protein